MRRRGRSGMRARLLGSIGSSALVPQYASSRPPTPPAHAEQHALGQQLPHDPAATGAERAADRQLARAAPPRARASGWRRSRRRSAARSRRRRACATSVGRSRAMPYSLIGIDADGLARVHRPDTPSASARPIVSISLRAAADGHAGLQAADGDERVRAAVLVALGPAGRHPQLARRAPELEPKARRHHADDRVRRAVDLDGPADDRADRRRSGASTARGSARRRDRCPASLPPAGTCARAAAARRAR